MSEDQRSEEVSRISKEYDQAWSSVASANEITWDDRHARLYGIGRALERAIQIRRFGVATGVNTR